LFTFLVWCKAERKEEQRRLLLPIELRPVNLRVSVLGGLIKIGGPVSSFSSGKMSPNSGAESGMYMESITLQGEKVLLGGGLGRRVETELPPSNTKTFSFTSVRENEGVEGGITTVVRVRLSLLNFLLRRRRACFLAKGCLALSAVRLDINAALVLLDEFLLEAKTWEKCLAGVLDATGSMDGSAPLVSPAPANPGPQDMPFTLSMKSLKLMTAHEIHKYTCSLSMQKNDML
jgi:hypothetical protein